ncbi:MAG: UDP-2,3-diacylglucosamine diphosphatase [Zoogloeaceae bacterium]|jgi:UDP-2,3-diacylglucosamine hydrolase|nr:UDP-2,3-diacylglucosamine diphosphatase [Zoogloeaceae bacterium]
MIHFVSDLHLSSRTPGAAGMFKTLLAKCARAGNRLYTLGDLFEIWVGDDDDDPFNLSIVAALDQARQRGLAVFLLHGNRDFLIGAQFAARTGVTLLPDPYVLSLPEQRFVLSHGDSLCADDAEYQAFRAQTRAPDWQAAFLRKPLPERRAFAEQLRAQSEVAKNGKSACLMDLNPIATDDFLRQHGYATFIHGHTHKPACHDHLVDGVHVERRVLADWSETHGETLVWDGQTLRREPLSRTLSDARASCTPPA